MVEVFKTNVTRKEQAHRLLGKIHKVFNECSANFDLDDCDHILRVECKHGYVKPSGIIRLLKELGFHAEVLPDSVYTIPPELLTDFNTQTLRPTLWEK